MTHPGAGNTGNAMGRPGGGATGMRAGSEAPSHNFGGHIQPRNATMEHRAGADISRRGDGQARDVHMSRGGGAMNIHHGLAGGRRVEVERGDHTRIVAERGGRGYVSHAYAFRGHEYGRRTYFEHGRYYDRFYSHYEYRPGVYLDVYAPVRYYPTAYYGWAYNPWVTPVPYAWTWAGAPWYAYYGSYFTPYPVYAGPSFWLTDYLISQSLAAAYQTQVDAQLPVNQPLPPGPPVVTPEIKQLIADEVKRQIALENAEAQANAQNADFNSQSSSIARTLGDRQSHVFVVGGDFDLVDTAGQECAVSRGDVLQYNPSNPTNDDGAPVLVLATKPRECQRGATVNATYSELQSMQNHMRETVDSGLEELQTHKGAIPAPPASAIGQSTQANFISAAPPADQNAQTEISQQYQEAERAEREALSGPGTPTGSAPPPPVVSTPPPPPQEVSLGMTVDQIVSMLGQPKNIMDVGPKKIYIYPQYKITFKEGKVSDIN